MSGRTTHITIVGVGLIGGSLGKSWRSHSGRDLVVTGVDTAEVLGRAVASGAIDIGEPDLVEGVRGADVVVLATPLARILHLLDEIAAHLRPQTIVTDVGSVKTAIAEHAASVLDPSVIFIGGHPMAGSEKTGIDYADPFLFENATYVICPPDDTPVTEPAIARLADLIQTTGARVLAMSPAEHDQIASYVSHLPQLLAICLTNVVADKNESDRNYLRLAAGGFRDMTRIAGSDFSIWKDILYGNQGPILDALASLTAEVQRLRNRIIEDDTEDVEDSFRNARQARETIPKDSKGFISPLADLYVHADDRPGWIASTAALLANANLNIMDMELLKVREGTGGTFRLGFSNRRIAEKASGLLSRAGYSVYRLD